MNTIMSALITLMSNPTTSAVLLAALIGSAAWTMNENSELERSNRQIEQQLSDVTAQLQRMADEQAKQKQLTAASQDHWQREKDYLNMMKKKFDEMPVYQKRSN